MTIIDAIILGIIQGLTEFLPISSSGHLKLAQYFLGLQNLDRYILFDLACHLGTLLAIILTLFKSIKASLTVDKTRFLQILVGTLPLFPLVLVLKPIKAIYADPSYLGAFFLLTSFILFLGIYFGKTKSEQSILRHPWRDAIIIGSWQAVAVLPGVSRSGSTISGARLLGWQPMEAAIFSFLLAIPAVLGGTILEVYEYLKHPETSVHMPLHQYFIGFFISLIVGTAALQFLLRIVGQNKFSYFAWYCLFLGLAIGSYFHLLYN